MSPQIQSLQRSSAGIGILGGFMNWWVLPSAGLWLTNNAGQLTKQFPGRKLPSLPAKKLMRSFGESHLNAKLEQFDRYLRLLQEHTDVAASEHFLYFLTNDRRGDFSVPIDRYDL